MVPRREVQRLVAACIAVSSWIAIRLIIDRYVVVSQGDLREALEVFASFLTHWSLVLTAVIFTVLAVHPDWRRAWWWTAQCLIVHAAMLVGYIGAFRLRAYYSNTFEQTFVHGPLTALVVVYWCLFVTHGRIGVRDVFAWLLFPLLYTGVMEVNGYFTHYYPYPQLDPFTTGVLHAGSRIAAIFLLTLGVSASLMALDRMDFGNRDERRG